MRLTQLLAAGSLLAAAACSSSSAPAAQPTATRTSPAPVLTGPAVAPKPLTSCKVATVATLNAATGLTWTAAAAQGSATDCSASLTAAGATASVDVTPSTTVDLDLQDRKRDLPTRTGRTELSLSGTAVGAAYVKGATVSYLLYVGHAGRVVSIVVAVPSASARTDAAGLTATANGIVAWALAQPLAR